MRRTLEARVPFRAGVIGCGRKGLTIDDERKCPINYCHGPGGHVPALSAMADVELVAVADTDPEQLRVVSERYPALRTYKSYDAMLAAEDLDLVTVATQTPEHAQATIAAAHAGVRAIICEKALATSMSEARAMLESCQNASAVLLVNHPRRYHPTYLAARQALAQDAIGELQAMLGMVSNGLVHNGSHFFDLFRFFAGDATSVRGVVRGSSDHDAAGVAFVDFAGGVLGSLDAQSRTEINMTIFGTRGKIVIDGALPGYELTEYVTSSGDVTPPEWFMGSHCKTRRVETVYVPADDPGTTVMLYLDAIRALEEGTRPVSSGEDGARALEIALGAFASHRLGGAAVPLPLTDLDLRIPSR
jgi:predicted dehydrogenase